MSAIPKDFALGANEYGNVQIRCKLCDSESVEIMGMEDAMRFMTRHVCIPPLEIPLTVPGMPGVIHFAELGACCIACRNEGERLAAELRRDA